MEMVSLISFYLEITQDLVGHFELRHLVNLIIITVPVNGLAQPGARPLTDTAMT